MHYDDIILIHSGFSLARAFNVLHAISINDCNLNMATKFM